MSPDSSQLIFAAVVTTVLLGIGAAAGYYAGMQVAVVRHRLAAPASGSHSASYWSLLQDIDRCTAQGAKVAEQGKRLVSLGEAQTVPIAAELKAAIEQLSQTTRKLAEGLHQVQGAVRTAQSARQVLPVRPNTVTPPPAAVYNGESETIVKPTGPDTIIPIPGVASSALTSAELSEFTGSPPQATAAEMRKQRHAYDCFQKLAPGCEDRSQVTPEELVNVRCHDISVEGISFFWPQKPDFEIGVISLGDGSVLMSVEIRQTKAVFMHGEVQYLVGCQFLKRVDQIMTAHKPRCQTAGR